MSNVVDFLDRIGRDAQLRYATAEEIERVLAQEQIDPAVGQALFEENRAQLEALLGAAGNICCMVHQPDEEEEEEPEEEEDDTDDGEEEEDGEEADVLRRRD
jgi:uncharacterized membrane protein YukC